jgi:DNA-binding transcriptional LysR family regulator
MTDWENLRHFLAVARIGTLSGAARALGVDHATVGRRLSSLEAELQVALVERLPRACRLTPLGHQVFGQVKAMEEGAFAIERLLQATRAPLDGKVSLSAPPVLVTQLLAGRMAEFQHRHPGVQLAISAQGQQVSLTRREADVALRLVRPKDASYVVRRIGRMHFGLYASRDYVRRQRPAEWEFIAFDAQFDEMPQQQWLLGLADGRRIACRLSDISGHLAVARAGAGVAGLPRFLGDADPGLQRLEVDGKPFFRDIWLLVHRDLRRSAPVRAVMDFMAQLVTEQPALRLASSDA